MMLNEETVDCPRAAAEAIEQLGQRCERFAIFANLPFWETEAALCTLQTKDLMVLTFGVDGYTAGADQLRKLFNGQHVIALQDLSDSHLPTFPRCGER